MILKMRVRNWKEKNVGSFFSSTVKLLIHCPSQWSSELRSQILVVCHCNSRYSIQIKTSFYFQCFHFWRQNKRKPNKCGRFFKGIAIGQPALLKTILALGNLKLTVLQRGYLEKVNMNILMPSFKQTQCCKPGSFA